MSSLNDSRWRIQMYFNLNISYVEPSNTLSPRWKRMSLKLSENVSHQNGMSLDGFFSYVITRSWFLCSCLVYFVHPWLSFFSVNLLCRAHLHRGELVWFDWSRDTQRIDSSLTLERRFTLLRTTVLFNEREKRIRMRTKRSGCCICERISSVNRRPTNGEELLWKKIFLFLIGQETRTINITLMIKQKTLHVCFSFPVEMMFSTFDWSRRCEHDTCLSNRTSCSFSSLFTCWPSCWKSVILLFVSDKYVACCDDDDLFS